MCQRDTCVRGWCVFRAPVWGCWCLEDDEPGFGIVMRLRRDDTDTDEGSCSGEVDVTQHVHQLWPTASTPGEQPHLTFEQDEVKDRQEHPKTPTIQIS